MSVSTFNFMSFVSSDFILEWIICIRKVFKTVGAIHLSKTNSFMWNSYLKKSNFRDLQTTKQFLFLKTMVEQNIFYFYFFVKNCLY